MAFKYPSARRDDTKVGFESRLTVFCRRLIQLVWKEEEVL